MVLPDGSATAPCSKISASQKAPTVRQLDEGAAAPETCAPIDPSLPPTRMPVTAWRGVSAGRRPAADVRASNRHPGLVDRQPAVLVCDPRNPSARPTYFILLRWAEGAIVGIRDFRYARYASEEAEFITATTMSEATKALLAD
jgi:hypothetical protein